MILNWQWIIFGIFFFVFFIVSLVTALIILNRLRWNYKWVLLEEQPNGQTIITKRGRCRQVSFGDGGEEIFYLKNMKKWRVAYGKRIGNRQIAWAVGQDGYWYNVNFSSLDKKLREVGVYPVDRDMRYAYASARKGIDNRYDKKSFMEKYGTVIAFGMLFICILAVGGFAYISYQGQAKIANINNAGMETQKEVMKLSEKVLSQVANIQTGGSGAVTVPPG